MMSFSRSLHVVGTALASLVVATVAVRRRRPHASRVSAGAFVLGLALGAALGCARGVALAQTAADVAAAVDKSCAVMAGERKADSQTLQYLMMMDEDLSDPNPVALALYRGVVHQCPKAYLAFEQRKRAANPFAHAGLTSGTPVQLTGPGAGPTPAPPATYALRCRGSAGIASAQGATLLVRFANAGHPAAQGLQPGQCSWLDRGLRPGEPSRIEVPLASAGQARNGVAQINAGGLWTFRVYNAGAFLRATVVAKGAPAAP